MTVYDLSPGFVLCKYTSQGRDHVQVLPVQPGTLVAGDPDASFLTSRDDTAVSFTDFAEDWEDVWDGFFDTTDTLASMELWSKPTPASNPTFVCSVANAKAGTSSGAGVPYSQAVLTWRTEFGGILKTVFMEQNFGVDVRYTPPYGSAAPAALSAYLLADICCVTGRDNGYVVGGIHMTTKTSDALRKQALGL